MNDNDIRVICPVCGLLGQRVDGPDVVQWNKDKLRLWLNPPDLPQVECGDCRRRREEDQDARLC